MNELREEYMVVMLFLYIAKYTLLRIVEPAN